MQQYLFNVTAIWLLSLAMYDVLLRKESYHGYNRMYLLSTVLLGLLLPLLSWRITEVQLIGEAAHAPIQNIDGAREAIMVAAGKSFSNESVDWLQVLTVIYFLGSGVALVKLLMDITKLFLISQKGNRQRVGEWAIIETGGKHAPFSFFRILYVSSRKQFTPAEWNMVLLHEGRHASMLHAIDVMLLQLIQVVCWFHPLVYMYNKRLRLLHEYQADGIVSVKRKEYGTFLIEQALLHTAPALTHAISDGSIGARIKMMSRQSKQYAKAKLLLFFPLVGMCVACFTKGAIAGSPHKEKSRCEWRGNVIEFRKPKLPDSYMHRNEQTGELSRMPIGWPEPPEQLNGERIFEGGRGDVVNSSLVSKENGMAEELLKAIKNDLEQLEDGDYFVIIRNVVVDKKGAVVYYENDGIFQNGVGDRFELKKKIDEKIATVLEHATIYKPATINGSAVACYYSSLFADTYGYNGSPEIKVVGQKVISK